MFCFSLCFKLIWSCSINSLRGGVLIHCFYIWVVNCLRPIYWVLFSPESHHTSFVTCHSRGGLCGSVYRICLLFSMSVPGSISPCLNFYSPMNNIDMMLINLVPNLQTFLNHLWKFVFALLINFRMLGFVKSQLRFWWDIHCIEG